MRTLIIAIALLSCSFLSLNATPDFYPLLPSDQIYFRQIQKAVSANDVKWLSRALGGYPFTVNLPSGCIKLKNEEDLKENFAAIFNIKLKEEIRSQSQDSLFKNWQGTMIGNGEIWFSEVGETNGNKTVWSYQIIGINVPIK